MNFLKSVLTAKFIYMQMTLSYTLPAMIFHKFNTLQSDFNLVQIWFSSNKLLLNKKKSYNMLFCTWPDPSLSNWSIRLLDGTAIETRHKIPGKSWGVTGLLRGCVHSVDEILDRFQTIHIQWMYPSHTHTITDVNLETLIYPHTCRHTAVHVS